MDNLSTARKIIYVIFGLVLLAVISEVGYFVYSSYIKPNTPTSVQLNVTPSPGSTTSPLFDTSKIHTIVNSGTLYPQKVSDFYNQIKDLGSKSSFFEIASINYALKGKVVKAEPEQKKFGTEEDVYVLAISNPAGEIIYNYYTANEINNARVQVISANGQSQQAKISDIRVGDTVSIGITINLLDASVDSELLITIVRAK